MRVRINFGSFKECKKTFFGKVKYFFKYSGKKTKNKPENIEDLSDIGENRKEETEEKIKKQYTLDELIEKGKKANEQETNLKNSKIIPLVLLSKYANSKYKFKFYFKKCDNQKGR